MCDGLIALYVTICLALAPFVLIYYILKWCGVF